jgi:predicted TIM-barrel enzyme
MAMDAGLIIAVPGLADFAPAERELAAMLPVADINGALVAAAAAFATVHAFARASGEKTDSSEVCAGLLMVDPFLVIGDLVAALQDGGFRAVANFPTVQLLDGAAGVGLAAVGYDLSAELRQLASLAARGFTPHVYVTDAAGARAALDAGFRDLVFHAAFRPAAEAEEALLPVRALVSAAKSARLRVHVPGGPAGPSIPCR